VTPAAPDFRAAVTWSSWDVCSGPDGRRLATAGDFTAKVLDARAGQEALSLQGHTFAHGVCFSPDGQRLAAALADGTAKVWDAPLADDTLDRDGAAGP
jgi:WD40 repeat protein